MFVQLKDEKFISLDNVAKIERLARPSEGGLFRKSVKEIATRITFNSTSYAMYDRPKNLEVWVSETPEQIVKLADDQNAKGDSKLLRLGPDCFINLKNVAIISPKSLDQASVVFNAIASSPGTQHPLSIDVPFTPLQIVDMASTQGLNL